MIIEKTHVEKFRGFQDIYFDLGSNITLIAGTNGTQKTTLLGILTQTFTIPKDSPLYSEKPACGGNFRSMFSEKFKLSQKFDIAKDHEWTLHTSVQEKPFTVASMERDSKSGNIRFWQKGVRSKGSGYLQVPVVYLSLRRLFPIGEDNSLKDSGNMGLTKDEMTTLTDWYTHILINRDGINKIDYLESRNKNTLGVSSEKYDWQSNSAGQDNIGKILLAVLSFKRLKEKHPNDYKGGIIAIDEIDAVLFPATQLKLFEYMLKFASNYDIQFIATTHSLTLLEKAYKYKSMPGNKKRVGIVYLKKENDNIVVDHDIDYEGIVAGLILKISDKVIPKIDIFTEDTEAADFTRAAIGQKFKHIKFVNGCTLGCGNLIQLATQKVPAFLFPNSIVILDGDINNKQKKAIESKRNFLLLPGSLSPEAELAQFLTNLDDRDPFWHSINKTYSKDICFSEFSLGDISNNRETAKRWYIKQKESKVWGKNASKLYKIWFDEYPDEKFKFCSAFEDIYEAIQQEINK